MRSQRALRWSRYPCVALKFCIAALHKQPSLTTVVLHQDLWSKRRAPKEMSHSKSSESSRIGILNWIFHPSTSSPLSFLVTASQWQKALKLDMFLSSLLHWVIVQLNTSPVWIGFGIKFLELTQMPLARYLLAKDDSTELTPSPEMALNMSTPSQCNLWCINDVDPCRRQC